jgi:peptidoglycan hydrolase-like protein with peptidoglycan-binding domain
MFSFRAWQALFLAAALTTAPAFAIRTHRSATAHHTRHHHRSAKHHARKHSVRGQRGIRPERATEIQQALIKQNYLTGTPSGEWDQKTEDAMKKYQADHGWQTRLTPDSRALIALGLGPDHSDAIPTVAKESAPTPATPAAANTLASTHIIQN